MSREKALETIIVLAFVLLLIYLWRDIEWLIFVSAGLLILPIISKKATILVSKVWHGFSNYFGIFMNHIIIFIIFYLFLFPLSQLQKLSGKNQILKKKNSVTYFHKRNHLFSLRDIERPW
ncbi:MAG: hypothetical protein JW717_00800 [Marinilabiliaceae bacterium]|nr:hypothetical protein [Marinilabiliaceae bacterium]